MTSRPHEYPDRLATAPTEPGWILVAILIAMLIGSINYANNMAYILCFLLTGLMLVGFLYTRNNLKGLEIINAQSYQVFAGNALQLTFELHNRTSGKRETIYAAVTDSHHSNNPKTLNDFAGPFTVEPFSRTTAHVTVPVPKRGRFVLPHIELFTLFPLGLFRSVCRVRVNKVYLVYPQPIGSATWPGPETCESETSENFYTRGGDDFVGVKPYRIGESQRHVDWKAVARGRPMSVKEFTGGGSDQLWFDWNHLGHMGTESRLSQLTRWVLEADAQGLPFGLRIPATQIEWSAGPSHTTACLEALALFQWPVQND